MKSLSVLTVPPLRILSVYLLLIPTYFYVVIFISPLSKFNTTVMDKIYYCWTHILFRHIYVVLLIFPPFLRRFTFTPFVKKNTLDCESVGYKKIFSYTGLRILKRKNIYI